MRRASNILRRHLAARPIVAVLLLSLSTAANAQQHIWSKGFGNSGVSNGAAAYAVAVDGHGDVVMGGSFQGSVDFGRGLLRASGDADGLVGKYSGVDGHPIWVAQIGGQGAFTSVSSVAVDSVGDVYVTGSFTFTVNVSSSSLISAGGYDVFVAKYAGATGTPMWSLRAGGTDQDKGYAVTVDTNDDVVVTGYFAGSASFGGAALTSAGGSDVFLAKYSGTDGRPLWSRRFGGTGFDYGNGVAAGLNGAIALTGSFSSALDLGGGSLGSAGGTDAFLAMYSANGVYLWSRAIGGAGDDVANAVASDRDGNPVITGYVYGSVNFGGGPLAGSSAPAIFLAKYAAADGAHIWSKSFQSPTLQIFGGSGRNLAVDDNGNVALTGSITDDVNFGGGALGAPYTADIFIAEFSASGIHLWSKRFPATYRDEGEGIAFGSGAVAVAGAFASAVDFGGGILSPGSNNAFLVELTATGGSAATPTFTKTPIPPTPTNPPTRTPTAKQTGTRTGTAARSATPVAAHVSVLGRVTYYANSQVLVPAVQVGFTGPATQTVPTDTSGNYSATMLSGGNWDVEPSKLGGFGNAVSALDAARVLQLVANLTTFTPLQRVACDVTGDGTVSALDAARILQFSAGVITQFPVAQACGSDWLFYPPSGQVQPTVGGGACQQGNIVLPGLNTSVSNQNFNAILFGDCTGNWTPSAGAALRLVAPSATVVRTGPLLRLPGHRVRLPVYVQARAPFQALDLRIGYDASALTFRSAAPHAAAKALVAVNNGQPGVLGISLASAQPIDPAKGAVLVIEFGRAGKSSRAGAQLVGAQVDERLARAVSGPAH